MSTSRAGVVAYLPRSPSRAVQSGCFLLHDKPRAKGLRVPRLHCLPGSPCHSACTRAPITHSLASLASLASGLPSGSQGRQAAGQDSPLPRAGSAQPGPLAHHKKRQRFRFIRRMNGTAVSVLGVSQWLTSSAPPAKMSARGPEIIEVFDSSVLESFLEIR